MTFPTIGVCGFGRCGSTMTMAMLAAAGVPFEATADPVSGEGDLARLGDDPLDGRAVKLLDAVNYTPLPRANWRFIWLDRDPTQQGISAVKMLALFPNLVEHLDGPPNPDVFAASYRLDRAPTLARLRQHGPVLQLQYERVLLNPWKAAKWISRFCAPIPFDTNAARLAVHDRTGDALPDLAFENGVVL